MLIQIHTQKYFLPVEKRDELNEYFQKKIKKIASNIDGSCHANIEFYSDMPKFVVQLTVKTNNNVHALHATAEHHELTAAFHEASTKIVHQLSKTRDKIRHHH